MSVVIKTSEMQYRDQLGNYHGINAIAEKKIADQVADLDTAIAAQESRIAQDISAAQTAVDGIDAQRQTMIASIASVAGQGTDTTLTQSGVAADAKSAGDEIRNVKSASDYLYNDLENTRNLFGVTVESQNHNGVTILNNHDGTYILNGTATASTYVWFIDTSTNDKTELKLPAGTHKVKKGFIDANGDFVSGSGTNIRLYPYSDEAHSQSLGNFGDDVKTLTYEYPIYIRFRVAANGDSFTNQKICIYVSSGSTVYEEPHKTAKDMIAREQSEDLVRNSTRLNFSTQYGLQGCHFETDGTTYLYLKITGQWYLRGAKNNGTSTTYDDIVPLNRYTAPSGETDCIRLASNEGIVYDMSDSTWKVVSIVGKADVVLNQIPIFVAGFYEDNKKFGVVAGRGQYLYEAYWTKVKIEEYVKNSIYGTSAFASQAEAVVKKVLADRDNKTVTFGLITDSHHKSTYDARQQARIFNRICEKCADFTVHLGDTINGQSTLANNTKYLTEYATVQNDTFLPFMYAIAHHEMYGQSFQSSYLDDPTAVPMNNVLGALGKKKYISPVYSASGDNWYFDTDGIRFISIDSVHNTSNGFNTEAIEFLQTAISTQNKVVVFAHVPANSGVNWNKKNPVNGDQIESILNAASADVLAYLHGHTHWDNTVVVSGNSFPYIATCCALAEKMDSSKFCDLGTPTVYDRTVGEYSEYCFDVVNLHTDTGTIKHFRFGVGSDRTYTQPS